MPQCVFKNCKNNYRNKNVSVGISYFRFPADPVLCAEWVSIVARERGEHLFEPRENSVVCSIHFFKFDITGNTQRRRLKKTAVPKLQIQPMGQCDVIGKNPINETTIPISKVIPSTTFGNVSFPSSPTVTVSDLIPVTETPSKTFLMSKLISSRQIILNKSKKIRNLKKANNRLIKKTNSLINIIQILKKKQKKYETVFLNLAKNDKVAELFNGVYLKNKKTA